MTIYTLGYNGWKIEEVEAVLAQLDAILVDVRMVPRTRWTPQWNGSVLHDRLGDRYVWLKQFGNRNYKGTVDQIEIADFPTGERRLRELIKKGSDDSAAIPATAPALPSVSEAGKSIILMCGCRDVNVCHRKPLAEWLANVWKAEVVHLTHPDNGSKSNQPTLF